MWLILLVSCRSPEPVEPVEDPSAAPIAPYDVLSYVDPIIATGGPGAQVINVNPGATVPFGMTQTGPDTRAANGSAFGALHCAGYYYDDTHIGGFSHTHALGMGVPDYGTVSVMPKTSWDPAFVSPKDRMNGFSHDDEEAAPGHYAVTMDDGTTVQIAPTQRGAVHEITFSDTSSPTVIVDLAAALGDNTVSESSVALSLAEGEVTGFQRMQGAYSTRFGGLQTWFHATVDPPPVSGGTWSTDAAPSSALVASAAGGTGAWLSFPEGTTTVTLRVALSYVDAAGASENHAAELAGRTRQAAADDAAADWESLLSRVRIRGDEAQKRIFHSAHYRSLIMPSRYQDVDGRYRGFDDQVHTADEEHYTDFSLWDTFRTTHPWYALVHPEEQAGMLRSLLRMTREGGDVPRWPLAHGYTSGMIGTPADMLFAESWLKGIRDFDVDLAFEAALDHSENPKPNAGRAGVRSYVENGYVSFEAAGQPASRTLEFAWADHALSLWAEGLGETEAAQTLRARADNWQNTWDPEQRWFVGRYADGTFATVEDPLYWTESYIEGNSWHYRWGAAWDVPGMVAVQSDGDTDAFLDELDSFWERVYAEPDDAFPDDYYWHGNEPDLHYAFVAALAGAPDQSADPVRWVLENRYDDGPHGLDGNDDGGTLSAWYLFASMGLYPLAGTDAYVLGSPVLSRVEIDRPEGTLVIRAPNVSESARYLGEVRLGDTLLTEARLSHADLVSGEPLVLEMQEAAGGWGR